MIFDDVRRRAPIDVGGDMGSPEIPFRDGEGAK